MTNATYIAEEITPEEVSAIDIQYEIGANPDLLVKLYRLVYGGGQRGDLAYWPDTGRAAVMLGGDSVWVDATSPEDALRQV